MGGVRGKGLWVLDSEFGFRIQGLGAWGSGSAW